MVKRHKVVLELIDLIKAHKWEGAFAKATGHAHRSNIPELADIRNLDDYLAWINDLLYETALDAAVGVDGEVRQGDGRVPRHA